MLNSCKPSTRAQLVRIKPLSSKLISTFTLSFALVSSAVVYAEDQKQANGSSTRLKTVTVSADVEKEASSAQLDYLTEKDDSGALGDKPILDTPFSIVTVDNSEILERGAKSLGQIFINDASIYAPTPSSSTDWWGTEIRGLPVRNFYVDDVPVLLYWGGDFPTEAAESITALKGLTGFMYGFGAPGGAISYKIKRPTDSPETFVNIGYRNSSLLSAQIDTSQNLGDDFAVRANLATEQGTAYNDAKIDRTVASLAIDKNFGDSVNWFTSVVYEKNKIEGEPLQFYFSEYDVQGSNGKLPKATYDYGNFNVDNGYYHTETLIASTGIDWQVNEDWKLKYKIAFSQKEHQSNKTFANLLNSNGDYTGDAYNFAGKLSNLFNQIMLQGNISTGDIEHEVVAGVGQQNSEDRWGTDWYWSNDFDGNIYQRQNFRTTRTPDFSLEAEPSSETKEFYTFASDTVHFNDHWQAIIGLRYTNYKLKGEDFDTKNTSPTLALIYKPDDNTSIYGSYVESLEPGSRVGPDYANVGEILDATVSKQYEVGVKHAAGKFNYTAAIFNTERANQMDVIRSGLKYLTQDGSEIYKGAELSTSYQFTDNLNLGLSALYLDGTVDKVSAEYAALQGKHVPFASHWQFAGNFEYKVAAVDGLKFHGNLRYFGESFIDSENTFKLPSRTILNVGGSYSFKVLDRLWTLNGNVNNLLNEKYWSGGGYSAGNMGEARNISLGLNTVF